MGATYVIRDLHSLQFNPVLSLADLEGAVADDVQREIDVFRHSNAVVLAYPIWFGSPPAQIVGYIDRVFGAGFGYQDILQNAKNSVLKGKYLVSLTSSGSMQAWLEEQGVVGSTRNLFERYLTHIMGFTGFQRYHSDGIRPGIKIWEAGMHLREIENVARATVAAIRLHAAS